MRLPWRKLVLPCHIVAKPHVFRYTLVHILQKIFSVQVPSIIRQTFPSVIDDRHVLMLQQVLITASRMATGVVHCHILFQHSFHGNVKRIPGTDIERNRRVSTSHLHFRPHRMLQRKFRTERPVRFQSRARATYGIRGNLPMSQETDIKGQNNPIPIP